jgi:AcrR family transcriptional regulator
MTTTAFARARNDAQRAQRRAAILAGAEAMLREQRVGELSLNELARRVGLAKSNVLRYFESREAVLLELYDREYRAWLDALEGALAQASSIEEVSDAVAATVADRNLLCELCANAAGVLERNVSGQVAADYKRAAIASAARLASLLGDRLGGLSDAAAIAAVSCVNVGVGGLWAATQPSPGMAAAYAANPELRVLLPDFQVALREFVATVLTGLRYREPDLPISGDDASWIHGDQ